MMAIVYAAALILAAVAGLTLLALWACWVAWLIAAHRRFTASRRVMWKQLEDVRRTGL